MDKEELSDAITDMGAWQRTSSPVTDAPCRRVCGNRHQRVCSVAMSRHNDSTISGRVSAAPMAATAPVTMLAEPRSAKSETVSAPTATARPSPMIKADDRLATTAPAAVSW